eukprot:10685531-Alexandrium_andersonii.AAC.1
MDTINPASGQGLPMVQAAVSGSAWLGPDPRTDLALQRSGLKTRVPVDWVGPEETELVNPLPPADRQLTP